MSIETLLSELTAAIRENTAALMGSTPASHARIADVAGEVGDAPAKAEEAAPAKRGRKPKTEVSVTTAEVPAEEPTPAPADNEVAGKSDGPVAASAEVDMAHYRATVKAELLAYRDAVKDMQPASMDPGEAVKAATIAAREQLTPFKAAKFDDVKESDLEKLRANIAAALAEVSAGDDSDDFDLDV